MIEARAEPLTWTQIHWRGNDILDVPPILLVTEMSVLQFRQAMARYMDGRHVNDALYRAVLAIRSEHELEPYPYVVGFPAVAFELPIDVREIADDPNRFVGLVKMPRGIREPGVNETGKELALELEELETKVPRDAARAWTCVGFDADHDIKMGMILVDESGALKVGDFWLFDD